MKVMHKTILIIVLTAVTLASTAFLVINYYNPVSNAQDVLHTVQSITFGLAILTGAGTAAVGYRAHSIKETDATNRRFKEAVDSMTTGGDEAEDVFKRIQGILALERLAFNAPDNKERQRVMDVLCGWLQEVRKAEPDEETDYTGVNNIGKDHEHAIKVIIRLRAKYKKLEVDLSKTNLCWADFQGANLNEANFREANLSWANFEEANLNGANFQEVNLDWANFMQTHLSGADFFKANCEYVRFNFAHCEDVKFLFAYCEGASFECTHCEEASFERAHCEYADFSDANCEGADFTDASGVNLRRAFTNEKTKMPEEITKVPLEAIITEDTPEKIT
ncbi:MAG: pentapeptide repeat-containing protein [Oscillospiraceae bacterium]|nr:pentapeptide repeat-containing protein [Oscillospiraceae bacterium]